MSSSEKELPHREVYCASHLGMEGFQPDGDDGVGQVFACLGYYAGWAVVSDDGLDRASLLSVAWQSTTSVRTSPR